MESKELLEKLKKEYKVKSYDEVIKMLFKERKELEKEINKIKSLELVFRWFNSIDEKERKKRIEEIKRLREKILR